MYDTMVRILYYYLQTQLKFKASTTSPRSILLQFPTVSLLVAKRVGKS